MQIANSAQHLRAGVKPYLPGQTEAGTGVSQLAQACDRFVSSQGQSANPYPDSLALADRLAVSRNLSGLAQGAQADFAGQVPGGQLTIGQLSGAVGQLQSARQAEVGQLQDARHALKSGYYHQVGKTCAWMGATAATLVAAGMFPNPVSGLVLAGVATMTIRSIGHARTAQAELAAKLPPIEASLKDDQGTLREVAANAPYLQGWNDLLSHSSGSRAA